MATANGWNLRPTDEGEDEVQFSDSNECRFIEFLDYGSLGAPTLNVGEIEEGTISSWFLKDLALRSGPNGYIERPLSGQRLLVIKGVVPQNNNFLLSIKEESFKALRHHITLPEDFLRILTSRQHTSAFPYFTRKDTFLKPLGFYFNTSDLTYEHSHTRIFLNHDCETNITGGLLIVNSLEVDETITLVRKFFDDRGSLPCNNVLFPLLIEEAFIDQVQKEIMYVGRRLQQIRISLGLFEFAESDEELNDPFEVDSLPATRSLNRCGDDLSINTLWLRDASIALDRLLEWSNRLNDSHESTERDGSGPGGSNRQLTISKVQLLKDRCNSILLEVDYNQERASRYMQVVFQIMAAKDAKVTIALTESSAAIAKANKEDSSSMKTIAVLGMFFLPGAFVAAMFAMPVFNWESDGTPVVKAGFGYYWAVTIPLTLVVLLSWAFVVLAPWRRWLLKLKRRTKVPREDVELTSIASP